jgi:WD40 repeat protein
MSSPRPSFYNVLLGATLMLLLVSCSPTALAPAQMPSPTPDYQALETRVAVNLSGTLTAKAPTATITPTRTETPLPPTATPTLIPTSTATATPTQAADAALLVLVRESEDQIANLVLRDLDRGTEETLTHLAEPSTISDVGWSPDGQWITFVSAHDYIHSRDQERNVFFVRPDGTELHMVTGSHIDPAKAPGPYIVLSGHVLDPVGDCIVSAQGAASPVLADVAGAFELTGVPMSAQWARAVCQTEGSILQGDVALELDVQATAPITIPLSATGEGWDQASLSSQGDLAGTAYHWWLDEKDELPHIEFTAKLVDLDSGQTSHLTIPEGSSILGVDWSPVTTTLLVGALSDEDGASLYTWPEFDNPQPLVRIENGDDIILSTAYPVWSPQGDRLTFELRQWAWWGENRYRTLLMVWEVDSEGEPQVLVEPDWGEHASRPSWSADGDTLYYQFSTGDPGAEFWRKDNGDIYRVSLAEPTPVALTRDGRSYLPAARPLPKVPQQTEAPSEQAEPTTAP